MMPLVLESPVAAVAPGHRLEAVSRRILTVAILIVFGSAAALLLLALPAADDFVRATQPIKFGYLSSITRLYTHWQGRWVAYGLESAVLPISDMTRIYPVWIGAVAIGNLLGIFVVCRCFTRSGSRRFSLMCTAGLAALLWSMLPSLAQAVYWFTGTVENAMVFSLAGLLLVGLITLPGRVHWVGLLSVLTIITCGLHEGYGAMLCIALAAGTVTAYWNGSASRHMWTMVLAAAVVGLLIVVLAPGNHVRMKRDGGVHSQQLLYDLRLTASQLWQSGREWLLDPKLIAVSLWIAFSPGLESARPIWPSASRVPLRWIIPTTWLAMLGVGYFAPTWAFGVTMPPRTLSGNFIVFALGWLLTVFIWTRRLHLKDSADDGGLRSRGATAVVQLLLAVSLILSGNVPKTLHDLANRSLLDWRASTEARYAILRDHPGQEIVLPRLSSTSQMLYSGEVGTDPLFIQNGAVADFFHVKQVRIKW